MFILLITAVGLFILIPQLRVFHNSLHVLQHPRWPYVYAAVLATLFTYLAGAATYCLLAWRRLRFRRVLLVQLAAMFLNRIVPSGIGGIGVNYAYLRRERHSANQAAIVVTINNFLGIVGHLALVCGVLLIANKHDLKMAVPKLSLVPWQLLSVIVAICVGGWLAVQHRQWLRATGKRLWQQLLRYRHRRRQLSLGLLSSIGLTVSNLICLELCAYAVGVSIAPAALVLIFTLGITLGTAIPTPGGVGGVEAGLVLGLVAYHILANQALAVALLYRLVSYWFMLLLGVVSFIYCLHAHYFKK